MANPYELEKAEHDRRYKRIADKYLPSCEAQENPRAIIIGGQPGSGKGQLTNKAARELFKEGGFVLVDADTLRERHPAHRDLMRENDREAANLTHNDASKWAKRLTTDAIPADREKIEQQRVAAARKLAAETFRQLPKAEALKTHPELAGAYGAVAAVVAKVKEEGLSADQRQVVLARTRHNVAASIEQGKIPQMQVRETQQQKAQTVETRSQEPER